MRDLALVVDGERRTLLTFSSLCMVVLTSTAICLLSVQAPGSQVDNVTCVRIMETLGS